MTDPIKPMASIKLLSWMLEYGEVHVYETPEGLEVWIGGEFRYRQPKPKIKIMCDCSASDNCPQGKTGPLGRCYIWKDNQK